MTRRPLIGLTADLENRPGGPTEAEYVLRRNYTSAIMDAGGLPVALPYDPDLAIDYVSRLDGLIVTGGMFDIDPSLYGEAPRGDLTTKPERTAFELALLDAAILADLPVLGICNGMQLLAVKLGGSLVQDIQNDIEGGIEHLPAPVPDKAIHGIKFAKGTKLGALSNQTGCRVNSLHHQAVRDAEGFTISAVCSEDGVAEAIEANTQSFCVGVQWHPEYMTSAVDSPLLKAFVDAALHFASRTDPKSIDRAAQRFTQRQTATT
mgnify:CR=1 FL=1|jgi:putative glutamine amidotransferase